MNRSPFSSRQVLPGPGQPLRGDSFRFGVQSICGNEVLWLGRSRPQRFLLVVLHLLFWRLLRVFGAHSVRTWKEERL